MHSLNCDGIITNSRDAVSFATLIIGRWVFGDAFCQFQGSVDVFANYVTPANLSLTVFNRYMKIVKRTTTIRFFRLAHLRYGWVACGFPLHFTCWLSESQIGLKSILFEATQCAPLITQAVKVKSFIIQSLLDYFLFYRCVSAFSVIIRYFLKPMSINIM